MKTDIKDKIRAMLRKAGEGNPSEAEREVALRMAHQLMLKHGLSESEIGNPDDDPGGFTQEPYFRTESESDHWKGTLLCNIAEFYFCDAYAMQPRWAADRFQAEWFLMGKEDHVEVFKMMFEFICPQIEAGFTKALAEFGNIQERHARTYCVETCKEMGMNQELIDSMTEADLAEFGRMRLEQITISNDPVEDIMNLCEIDSFNYAKKVRAYIKRKEIGRGRPDLRLDVWRNSFFMGAVAEIRERIQAMNKQEVEDLGSSGMALVLNEKEALVRWQEDIGHETEQRSMNQKVDREGVHAGMEAGANADLMPGRKLNLARGELNA